MPLASPAPDIPTKGGIFTAYSVIIPTYFNLRQDSPASPLASGGRNAVGLGSLYSRALARSIMADLSGVKASLIPTVRFSHNAAQQKNPGHAARVRCLSLHVSILRQYQSPFRKPITGPIQPSHTLRSNPIEKNPPVGTVKSNGTWLQQRPNDAGGVIGGYRLPVLRPS